MIGQIFNKIYRIMVGKRNGALDQEVLLPGWTEGGKGAWS